MTCRDCLLNPVVAVAAAASSTPTITIYPFANAASSDSPAALGASQVTGGTLNEQVAFTSTISLVSIPGALAIGGMYREWLIQGILGATAAIDQGDVADFLVWLVGATNLPVDMYLAVVTTAGGVAGIGNAGHLTGIRYSATGPEVFLQANAGAGAGWGSALVATAVDPLTRAVKQNWLPNNTNSSAFRQATPLVLAGTRSVVSGASPIAPSANTFADGDMTHVAIVCGWVTGVGGTVPQTVTGSVRSFAGAWGSFARSAQTL